MKKRYGIVRLGVCLLVLSLPCAAQDDLVLAQIANQPIAVREFRAYAAAIPQAYHLGKTGIEADRLLLNGLIDKKLLLAEAERVGIGDEQEFKRKVEQFARDQTVRLYRSMEIDQRISIAEEELMQHYRDSHRDRALRYAGILVATRDEALTLIDELAAGADFRQLAREHSLYEATRDQGGDVGKYYAIDDTAPPLRSIFSMQVGEVSAPLPWGGDPQRYVIVKVLDDAPVTFQEVASFVREEVFAQKRLQRAQVLRDSLSGLYAPQIHDDAIDLLMMRLTRSPAERVAAPEEGEAVLCRYNGGVLTIDDFVLLVPEKEEGYSRDYERDWIVDYLRDVAIPNRMFFAEARGKGLDKHQIILAAVANKRSDMLVSALRKRAVEERLPPITDAEARAFYDQNPEKFQGFENIVTTEILVAFKEQAHSLKEELLGGADAVQLARDYTIRKERAHHEGRLVLSPVGLYQDLYQVGKNLQVGDVGGPVKVRGGYSVFKVEEKQPAPKKPYHVFSQRRARAYVKIARSQKAYVQYMRGLHEQYSVEVFEDNLLKIQEEAEDVTGG